MESKSCFFVGHRDTPSQILPVLEKTIEIHIKNYGVKIFIVGGYGGFDRLVATALLAAKKKCPEITLLRLIPYHPAVRPFKTPVGFDNTYYPSGLENVPRKFAIVRANQYVVDQVDYLITYARHSFGNAHKIMEYAAKRKKNVCNLAE